MTVNVTRISQLTGNEHTRAIPLSPEDFDAAMARWEAGEYIQNAFPTLSDEDREFLLTGITPQEWDEVVAPDYDDYEEDDDVHYDSNGWTDGWWAGSSAPIHRCGYVDPTGDYRDEGVCPNCDAEKSSQPEVTHDPDLPF